MANKVVPQYQQSLATSKSPKVSENPAQYKDMPIAWQLSFIDDESRWGTKCLKENISLSNYDEIVRRLPKNVHNDLYDALGDLVDKRFNSIAELFEAIKRNANDNITVDEQQFLLNFLKENPFWTEIYTKIRHFETNTWHAIERELFGKGKRKTKHHSVSVSKIIPEAQKRLETLHYDDIDELFSVRLDGEMRIWGIRTYSYLKVLWIDLKHEICPTQKD
jgi:hypothetical protein